MKHKWPQFDRKSDRDEYLDKLVANGYQVKPKFVPPDGEMPMKYMVEDIDKRKGK